MSQFEYMIIDSQDVKAEGVFKGRSRESLEDYLNSLGELGWELVNVDFRELEGGFEFAGVMKRQR